MREFQVQFEVCLRGDLVVNADNYGEAEEKAKAMIANHSQVIKIAKRMVTKDELRDSGASLISISDTDAGKMYK